MSKTTETKHPTPSSLDEVPEIDLKKARILGRGLRKDRKLPLRALREAVSKTQEEIASAAGMDECELARASAFGDILDLDRDPRRDLLDEPAALSGASRDS